MFKITKRPFITVAEICYREFLGSNRIELSPGLRINIPIIHTLHRVDKRESGIDITNLNCFTKDNVPVIISKTLFYKIENAEKACFEVVNYPKAVCAVGSSSTRAVIGRFDYDETIKERNELNLELLKIGELNVLALKLVNLNHKINILLKI